LHLVYRRHKRIKLIKFSDFEPVQEDITSSPDSRELANYEEYSRQELPRFFRRELEAAVNDETQPIEDRLKSRLVEMIRDCQDRVFTAYRTRLNSSRAATQICTQNLDSSLAISTASSCLAVEKRTSPLVTAERHNNQSTTILDEFYGGPPPSSFPHIAPDFLVLENSTRLDLRNEESSSGSVTGPSLTDSGTSAVSENWMNNLSTNNGSQNNFLSLLSDTSASQPESYRAFLGSTEEAPGAKGSISDPEFDVNFASMFPLEDLYALFPYYGS